MPRHRSFIARVAFTALVWLAQLAHLAWDHAHGGIPSHHLLANPDLPAVSNAWGIVLLPALTWWLTGRIRRRVSRLHERGVPTRRAWRGVAIAFAVAAVVGIALSVAFSLDAQTVASTVFIGMLLAALVLPVYRAECVLGFVLAMAYVFGPVLPVAIGGAIAAVSFVSTSLIHVLTRGWVRGKRDRRLKTGLA